MVCGYTPNIAACVGMGFPDGERTMVPVVGTAESFGGSYPATIWRDFMTRTLATEPNRFPPASFPSVPPPAGWYQPASPPGRARLLKQLMNSYGKTWHTWHTGRHDGQPGDRLPL